MPRILVLDNLSEEGVEILRAAPGFEVDVKPAQKPEQLAQILPDYDGLVVRSATKVTAESLKNAKKLKVIGRAGVGTDNVDKDAATNLGIVVMNTPGGNTISTCEHTFALLFALCRNIPKAHATMMEGRWDRKNFMGTELCGKTLGVLGVGRIGGAVAKRAQAFEMKVIAFDPILTQMKADALGVELVSLDELIERSDFISVHAPKTEKTNNLIKAAELRRMKPTCRIVNCARGGIINEADLAQALWDKVIAGAALDVYTSEPLENNPFLGLDNVVTTPHLAASTDEAQLTVAVDIAKQIVDYLTTGAIINAVNVPSLDSEQRKTLQPLLYLAEKLGRFQSGFMRGRPISIEIEYAGDLGVTDTYPISAAVMTGFLSPLVESVNAVSAPVMLKHHGIESKETRRAIESNYTFEIGVTVTTDQETHRVAGTLFSKDDPRICLIDDIRMDAHPEGWILVCLNEDKPKTIGTVACILGDAGINIANLTLGRVARGGLATTLLNLDEAVPEAVLDKVRKSPHVKEVRLVAL
ncbi:MAG: phosphoglycerate dehydrogenase [Candidatus Hydrogenedentes bacterium]|nr:phosphoglycerate dehydrogenase [Candidatus Hydrogenedentota bacterium]